MSGPLQRQLFAWKWQVRQFFFQRWKEIPAELAILFWHCIKWIPGIPRLQYGRLYGHIHRRGPNCPAGYQFYQYDPKSDTVTYRIEENGWVWFQRFLRKDIEGNGWCEIVDLGCMGCHLIVTAGKNYVAGAFNNTNEPENLKYHAFGSGTTAAAAGDTALQTEYTTQYAVASTRPTGSQSVSTNVYTTIGTFSPSATVTTSEWGLESQAATGGGTLFDRQVFTGVALTGSSDSLQTTYALTVG